MKWNIALLILSVIFSLLLGETVVRALHLAPKIISLNANDIKSGYMSSSNPILGYELRPNYHSENPSFHFGDFSIINSHGQRDIERTYEKPKETTRILLLGDSVVAGHGIANLDNTISRELEKILQKGSKVEVLNFGVGGYQTLAEVELLKIKGLKYNPDVVILVFENNDFVSENTDMCINPEMSKWEQWLFKKSHLFRLIAFKTNLFGLSDFDKKMSSHRKLLKDSVDRGIGLLKDLSAKNNFDVFVVTWPRFSKNNKNIDGVNNFYPLRRQVENLIKIEKICKKHKVDSYRLVPYFIKDYDYELSIAEDKNTFPTLNDMYTIGDTCHPNTHGSLIAARGIAEIYYSRYK